MKGGDKDNHLLVEKCCVLLRVSDPGSLVDPGQVFFLNISNPDLAFSDGLGPDLVLFLIFRRDRFFLMVRVLIWFIIYRVGS